MKTASFYCFCKHCFLYVSLGEGKDSHLWGCKIIFLPASIGETFYIYEGLATTSVKCGASSEN